MDKSAVDFGRGGKNSRGPSGHEMACCAAPTELTCMQQPRRGFAPLSDPALRGCPGPRTAGCRLRLSHRQENHPGRARAPREGMCSAGYGVRSAQADRSPTGPAPTASPDSPPDCRATHLHALENPLCHATAAYCSSEKGVPRSGMNGAAIGAQRPLEAFSGKGQDSPRLTARGP